ncbi:MAG: ATP-binding protein [Chthoniobacterales bacterium]
MTATTTQLVDAERPWIGLKPFTENEREFFAGRGEEIDELLRLVRRDTHTLLYGVSGLGKTSLLQAGIFPAVRAENWLPVPIRLDYLEAAPPLATQVIRALTGAAQAAEVELPQHRPGETLWEYFHREGNHFWSARNDLITPFLAFDQFEEAFTLGSKTPARSRRISDFIIEFADLVENRPPAALRDDPERAREFSFKPASLRVLLAMREDYLAELDRIRSQFRAFGQNRLRLLPMGAPQARQVINLGAPLLAPGVADRIVTFVAGGAAAAEDGEIAVAPALLSLVLHELNERRLALGPEAKITPDLLDVEQPKIIEDFYVRTLQDFPASVRNFIEDELLTATGYRDSCALDDALSRPGVTRPILDELVNRRLLAYEDRHRVRRVEITHDILARVIKTSRDLRLAREALEGAERIQAETREKEEAVRQQIETNERERAARRRAAFVSALLVVALAGAGYGFLQASSARKARKDAEKEKAKAEEALVASFLRTIGVSAKFLPSYGEREDLWVLSTIEAENPIRKEVIGGWVRTASSLEHALAYNGRGLHAAIALNRALEDNFRAKNAQPAAKELALVLTNPQETNPNRLWSVGNALVALAPNLDATAAASVANGLATALEDNPKETSSDRKSSLGNALAGVAARLTASDAAPLADRGAKILANALEVPQETDAYRLWKLGTALAGLVARLDSDGPLLADRGTTVLTKALENPQETDFDRLWCLSEALAALKSRSNPAAVAAATTSLAAALKESTETDRQAGLGTALAGLAVGLDPTKVAALTAPGARVLADALKKETDPYSAWKLGTALSDLAAGLTFNDPDTLTLAAELAAALENQETNPDRQPGLGIALAGLAARLDASDRATLADRGAKVLTDALKDESDSYRAGRLGTALAALAAGLNRNAVHTLALAHDLAASLENPEETNPDRQSGLGTALAGLAARLDAPDRAPLANSGTKILVKALEGLPETDSSRRYDLGSALTALAVQVQSARVTRLFGLSNLLLNEVPKKGGDGDQTRTTITDVCHSLNLEELTEVLKGPFCVGEAQKLVLSALEDGIGKKTGREPAFDGDVWKFGKFVQQTPSLGINNLDGPAIRPTAEGAIAELKSLPTKGK